MQFFKTVVFNALEVRPRQWTEFDEVKQRFDEVKQRFEDMFDGFEDRLAKIEAKMGEERGKSKASGRIEKKPRERGNSKASGRIEKKPREKPRKTEERHTRVLQYFFLVFIIDKYVRIKNKAKRYVDLTQCTRPILD